jgi:hypothetical protein
VNPLAVMLIYVFIPPIIILVTIKVIWKTYKWRGSFLNKLVSNFGVVINHHAPLVTCVNIFLAGLLFINQGAYVIQNLNTTSDVKYYLRVDRPEFVNFNLIFNAQALNSVTAIRQQVQFGFQRRLADTGGDDDGEADATNQLNLIYHRSDWGDVTGEQQLIDICHTERNILNSLPCLESEYEHVFKSFITNNMNTTTCQFLRSYEDARGRIGYFANQRFFSDRTMYSSAHSPILISYFRMGSCGSVYGVNEFVEAVNALAVNETVVVPASFQYLAQDFREATHDLRNVMFWSTLFCYIFLVFSVRGFVVATATMFCIALALVNGAAMVSQFGYSAVSAFDVVSLLVILSVGAGFVHLYGSAWRRTVKRGKNASAQCLMVIFGTVGKGNLLTFLACCLAFFALGTSPSIFMSQMGYFIGISMFVFFLSFHYIIVPLWVWTSWYTIPQRYHNNWRIFRQKHCMWMLTKHETVGRHHHHHHHPHDEEQDMSHVLGAHGLSGEDHDDAMVDGSDDGSSVSTVSVAIIAPDQVRFASEAEGKTAEAVAATALVEDEHGNYVEHHFDGEAELEHEGDYHPEEGAPRRGSGTGSATGGGAGSGSVAAGAAGAVTTTARSAGQDDEGTVDGGSDEWACTVASLCSGKRPVKVLGLLALAVTLFLVLLCTIGSQQIMETNFAYARLINPTTNLQNMMRIFQYYRGDVFYAVDDDNAASITIPGASPAPSFSPTARPTVAGNPTPAPTFKPTVSPRPTIATTGRPTLVPTALPTREEGDTTFKYTDFRVTGCWGLSPRKTSYDSGVSPHFSYDGFKDYMALNNQGLLGDMLSVCDYVDSHKDYLSVHPDWNRSRDCIHDQVMKVYDSSYFHVYNRSKTVANTLIFWGTQVDTAPSMVGLYSNATGGDTVPVWVCANFTGRTYLRTFHDDMSYGTEMRQRWENAFYKHGRANAKANGVPVAVGSTAFTFPLLGLYITAQIQYQAMVFILGFPVLLLLFTEFDYGLTFFGVLGLFTIYLLTIFIGLNQISPLINLGDVVVLIVLLPYMVCFNIHLITAYMSNRTLDFRKTGRVEPRINFVSPALIKTYRYMVKALTGPLILAVLASIAFMWSKYPMLRRFGRYYLLCALVAYVFCVTIQPFLLAFSCKCTVCTFDYVQDEDQDIPPTPAQPAAAQPSSSIELAPRSNSAPPSARRPPPSRSSVSGGSTAASDTNFPRHGSQFAMGSVYNNSSQFAMVNDSRGDDMRGARPAPSVAARSVVSGAGSVASWTELHQEESASEDGGFEEEEAGYGAAGYDSLLPPNAVHLGTQQYVTMEQPAAPSMGVAYGAPQPIMQAGYSYGYDQGPGPEYGDYGQPPQYEYDEYGRPLAPMPMPPMPQQPVMGYRRVPSRMQVPSPPYQPMPPQYGSPQQYYYPGAPSPAAAMLQEQDYGDEEDGGSVAYSQASREYTNSPQRQMFLPPTRLAQPQAPTAAPSFYANGRNPAAPRGMPRQQSQYMRPPVAPAPGYPPQQDGGGYYSDGGQGAYYPYGR